MPCGPQSEDERHVAALKLIDVFLDGVFMEREFTSVRDRGTALALALVFYLEREQIEPQGYLEFVGDLVARSLKVDRTSRDLSDGGRTCH